MAIFRAAEPAPQTTSSLVSSRGASLFVWGVWALMQLAALVLVGRYGNNVPFQDEWGLVPVLTGRQPITLGFLWAQHNDHRIFLPRLLYFALLKLSGGDFRSVMLFNAVALGALAFAMIWVARRVRGQTSYADAFFPLALLHWGHYENILWSFQVQFVLSTTLAGVLLLIVVRYGDDLTRGAVFLAGVCLLLLPLCGANGLAYVPALALWLAYAGVVRWRRAGPGSKRDGLVLLAFALAAFALVAFYFVGYQSQRSSFAGPGLRASVRATLQLLSFGFGPAAPAFWPYLLVAAPLLMLISAVVLLRAGALRQEERTRALGLLLFLGGVACLALGIGWGRSEFYPRYTTLMVPSLCCVYFVWTLYGVPTSRQVLQMGLFTLMASMGSTNFLEGRDYARGRHEQYKGFERDLTAGNSVYELVKDHGPFLAVGTYNELIDSLRLLHDAKIGQYQRLQPNAPPVREVPLPVVPAAVRQATWNKSIAVTTDGNAHLLFTLKKAQPVHAIRLRYTYKKSNSGPGFGRSGPVIKLMWKHSGQNQFAVAAPDSLLKPQPRQFAFEPEPSKDTVTIWVFDTLDQFRIYPDTEPCVFQLSEIVLLVPTTKKQTAPDL